MSTFILENETLRLEFAPETGALVGITAVQTGWQILNRPHLGLSFRLLVPLRPQSDWHISGQRNNTVNGEKQKVTSIEITDDHRSATFVWDGVTSEHGGELNIKVTLDVKLSAQQAIFAMTVENRSAYVVENVYCPYLGDVQHPPQAAWLKTFLYNYATPQEWPVWPTFQNMRGYYGFDYPTQVATWSPACGAPAAPYILLRGEKHGL
jgi:hypothetical protein